MKKTLDFAALDGEHFLSREQAGEFFVQGMNAPVTAGRLAKLATEQRGPTYTMISGRAMYRVKWLRSWLDQESQRQLRQPVVPRSRRTPASARA